MERSTSGALAFLEHYAWVNPLTTRPKTFSTRGSLKPSHGHSTAEQEHSCDRMQTTGAEAKVHGKFSPLPLKKIRPGPTSRARVLCRPLGDKWLHHYI